MKHALAFLAVTGLASSLFSTSIVAAEKAVELSNKDKALALLNSIQTGDSSAVAYVNPDKYIQHNLAVADGLAGFAAILQALPKDSAKVEVIRSFEDGDFVFTQSNYDFFGEKVGFDVFRFEDGLIVEHWDNLVDKADAPNPSGRTQLDGPTQISDLGQTEANKSLVSRFVDKVLVNGQFDQLPMFIDERQYHQHNTAIADGLSGLSEAIAVLQKQGINMTYEKNHKVLGEGNFVLSISEGTFGDQSVAYYDLFRVEASMIVEHWDVIEPVLPQAEWKNDNGKFGGF